jgi:hypothetical protein
MTATCAAHRLNVLKTSNSWPRSGKKDKNEDRSEEVYENKGPVQNVMDIYRAFWIKSMRLARQLRQSSDNFVRRSQKCDKMSADTKLVK